LAREPRWTDGASVPHLFEAGICEKNGRVGIHLRKDSAKFKLET
jgi:hypothetical protein